MVLGYSRAIFAHFTTTQRLETFLGCHLRAFEALEDDLREFLYDHVKTVVLARLDRHADAPGQTPCWHPTCLDLGGYDGFTPRLCWPYRARTKDKVERMIRDGRESVCVGRQFVDLADLNREAALRCATVANGRVHATTGEVPAVRLAREL